MRQNFLLLSFLLAFGIVFAQKNATVVVFSEQGERFQLVLNGLLQNQYPQTNVKVEGLNAENYFLKIMFEDASIPEFDLNFFATPLGYESTYKLKKMNTGKYSLRPVTSVEMNGGDGEPGRPVQNQQVVVFNPTATPWGGTTTTGTSMSTNITVGGATFSNDINIGNQNNDMGQIMPAETQPIIIYVPGYTGQIGCLMPMDAASFAQAKQSIKSKSFEDDKLKIAKQILNNNCVTTNQVKELMGVMTFEDSKLELAKYCWGYTYDVKNYYLVNDAFTFSSSIDDLNDYMAAHPVNKQYGVAGQNMTQTNTPKTPPKTSTYHNTNTGVVHNPGNTGIVKPNDNAGKCTFPMSDVDFSNIKNTIKGQSAEDSKLKVAKQLVSGTCLRSAQIKELLDLLSFESNRLNLAKHCYKLAFDPQSYFLIDNALATKASRDDLEAYINTQK